MYRRDSAQQLCAYADRHRRPPQPGHRRVRDEEAEELRRHHGDVQAVHLLLIRKGVSGFFGLQRAFKKFTGLGENAVPRCVS